MPLAAVDVQAIILGGHSHGVLAQLVERLNGIEEVRGSNPLGSIFETRDENLGSTTLRVSASSSDSHFCRACRRQVNPLGSTNLFGGVSQSERFEPLSFSPNIRPPPG